MRIPWISLGLALLVLSCSKEDTSISTSSSDTAQVFKLLAPEYTGVAFNNAITEDATQNHLISDVFYNGGGVGVVDINNDGLLDLFFAGNQVSDRLYLNKGNLQFEDITESAGIVNDTWSTAIGVADVNNDGWMDIYVGKYMLPDPEKRRNALYINNGDNTFSEKAGEYGLDHPGYCTAVNFFDYDKDGWLDLYVGVQPFVTNHDKMSGLEQVIDKSQYSDRLYHNNGDGAFTDVTQQAGITNYTYTLSATVSDLNNDGWLDIYVANDYDEPDNFFKNNQNGTFTDIARTALRHISNFSMGADLADINNDGWTDLCVLDMVAADNYRLKANMGGMNPDKFWALANAGYHYQYMFNMLQLNNGTGTYSEIAQMAGISNTDWSWGPILADFDNDGDKDLMIANGLVRDIKNKDYMHEREHILDSLKRAAGGKEIPDLAQTIYELTKLAPSVKLPNYLFSNQGDLTFQNRSVVWGMGKESWSNGAAYADLDNDGDLDIAVNNIGDPAFIFENQSRQLRLGNYLQLELLGDQGNNHASYGAKAWVYTGATQQIEEVTPTRGYFSASTNILHFGLGPAKTVDRLIVKWPDGRTIEMEKAPVNQRLTLRQADGKPGDIAPPRPEPPLFQYIPQNAGIDIIYRENEFDDYAREVLLPHRMSTLGPCTASADVNGDGLEDFFIGGSAGHAGVLFLQRDGGLFVRNPHPAPWEEDKDQEDAGAHFFDTDGDGDLDLYVVSGGNEFPDKSFKYLDRLYINTGSGRFMKAKASIPNIAFSGGVAKSGDFDGDGDADLFVGGRQAPWKYGYPAPSYIYQNEKGYFRDITHQVAPEFKEAGMVTDAQWLDWDKDGDLDLIVVGEWMPISFFENENGKLRNATTEMGMENTAGWWNRLEAADLDGDGDLDLVAGNLGLNIKYKASEERPFRLYVKDFDGNGTNDIYLGYYDADGVCYPVRGRSCSSQQMPYISEQYKTYDAFAKASIEQVLGERVEGALERSCQLFESVWLENTGGQFAVHKLPTQAQIAPVFGIACFDWNGDGTMDIALTGNYYHREVETVRSDAGSGCLLLGDGKGNFKALPPYRSGLLAVGDARSSEIVLDQNGNPMLLVANNGNYVQVFQPVN